MKSIFHKTLALALSVSMLMAYSPLHVAATTLPLNISEEEEITVANETFDGNTALGTNGWANIENAGTLTLDSVTLGTSANGNTGQWGVIDSWGELSIKDSTFTNNQAVTGGVLYNEANASIDNTQFLSNKAQTGDGGSIFNISTLTIDNSSFSSNEANSWGGAIANGGTLTVSNTTFDGNKAENAGVLIDYVDSDGGVKFLNSTITNTTATEVGALALYSRNATSEITNTTFTNNHTTFNGGYDKDNMGGAAISIGAEAMVKISGSTFEGNSTDQLEGGAIGTRKTEGHNNSGAKLDIISSSFTANSSNLKGGALENNFYNSDSHEGAVSILSSTFDANSSVTGGAIYNNGTEDLNGNAASLYIQDSTFTNNTASENGGAIYNGGTLTLAGTNTFTGNTAAEGADIYNTGILNINDTTTIDGGIAGNGTINVNGTLNIGQAEVKAGTLAFANGSTLGVEFGNDNMGNLQADTVTIGDGANLQVTLSKDFLTTDTTTHDLITADTVTGAFTLANVNNALYNVSLNEDHQVIAQRKSQEEQQQAINQAGGTSNDATVLEAYTSSSDLGNDTTNKVADIINQLAQTDTAKLVEVTKAVAPEVTPAKQVVHTAVLNEVFGALQHRMADASTGSPAMYALNDAKNYQTANTKHFSVWTQGLLNKSHKEATSQADAFTGRSTGVAAGADMRVGESGLVGLGYAYTHSNVNGTGRHDRILGNNFFLYSQYRPSAFYMQGSFAYGDAKYEEKKYLPGLELDANYHVQHYALQGRMGYDVTEWFSPNMGLRYTRLHQEGYTDGAQSVSADNANYFTGMLGADFQMEQRLNQHMSLLPHLYTGLSYDFVSDDNNSRVTLPNATGYNVVGERLHRLAFEVGAGVTARLYSSVEVVLGYEGSFRQDYNAHTGTLKLRYLF